ncbi:hypothetical protein [uncultured Rubinisphaera sp.]|uniref:hypothetical protein n=1 Tax=uncultured Rubinisphaera sp. TaxID=1678686 RepID=UPI0030D99921
MNHRIRVSSLSLFLVLFTLSFKSGAVAVGEEQRSLKGQYQQNFPLGNFVLGGTRIRCFAFTFTGDLNKRSISNNVNIVVNELRQDGLFGKQYRTNPRHRHDDRFALQLGEVFVFGYENVDQGTVAWIACDCNDDAFPKHNWISSGQQSGTMDSSKAGVEPAKAAAIVSYMTSTNSGRDMLVRLELFSSAGWISWYHN